MSDNLISLKRWHWMTIAVLIGLAVGYVARPTTLDLRGGYGEARNGQKEFETAMLTEAEGRRRFKDIVIHRQMVPNPAGGEREVWIISGIYCSNTPDRLDGKLHWKPTFFVASDPYRPAIKLSEVLGKSPAAVAHFEKIAAPTVLDFLQLVGDSSAVQYRHAWWRSYPITTWLVGSIILIGILWPTAIDLIVFGRLVRPREPKLADRPSSPTIPRPAKTAMSREDLEKLQALDAAMEANEMADAIPAPIAATGAAATPVVQLHSVSLPASPAEPKKARAFGAGAEDFYPTEQKAKVAAPKK